MSDPNEATQWAGLKVQFAGSPIGDAKNVVILLHGYGARGDDLLSLSGALDTHRQTAFIFPQAPVALDGGGFAWTTGSNEQLEDVCNRILSIVKRVQAQNISAQVTVGGFSQGATVSSNLLSNAHDGIASLLLFSPGSTRLHPIQISETAPSVFLSHGRNDEVLPFSGSEQLRDDMKARGIIVDWHTFEGGHELTTEVISAARAFLYPTRR